MKNLLLALFLAITNLGYATICTLIVDNGDWSNSSSWSCGYAPASAGDTMRIPASMTVVVDINSSTYVNMRIEVYGTMQFSNGQKINMDADGVVEVYVGGTLTGGNSGSKLNIGATAWWSGNEPPIIGPTIVSNSGFLPIELIDFNAIMNEDRVEISWTTASEINNDYFIVERSEDVMSWVEVIKVSGAGHSVSIIDYFEIDNIPLRGLSYYRLTQVDFDGKQETFNIIPVENAIKGEGIMNIYPNPVNKGECISLSFEILHRNNQEILVLLRDIRGVEVYSKIEIVNCDNGLVVMDIPQHLTSGTYLVVAASENLLYSKRIIIK
tara:strand:+ start:3409 stop:4383 length:975 start_codon:yes stop_codon:yes gene_type:complete